MVKYKKKYHIRQGYYNNYYSSYYRPTLESFCIGRVNKSFVTLTFWESCRETFAFRFKQNTQYILFFHRKGIGVKLAKFLNLIEKKLKIKQFSSVSGATNSDTISIIKLSPWWRANSMRRSFLTALLRSQIRGTKFDKVIASNKYFKTTPEAIEKFFKGYTKYRGNFFGWQNTFGRLKYLNKMYK